MSPFPWPMAAPIGSPNPDLRRWGGIFAMTAPETSDVPECWMGYIAVDDVDARVEKARASGTTIVRSAFDMPKVGRIAILREPGGAVLGWMTPSDG